MYRHKMGEENKLESPSYVSHSYYFIIVKSPAGWGFSSEVERLPRERKALGSVPSSGKKKKKRAQLQFLFQVRLLKRTFLSVMTVFILIIGSQCGYLLDFL